MGTVCLVHCALDNAFISPLSFSASQQLFVILYIFVTLEPLQLSVRNSLSVKYHFRNTVDSCTLAFVAAVKQSALFAVFRTHSPNLPTYFRTTFLGSVEKKCTFRMIWNLYLKVIYIYICLYTVLSFWRHPFTAEDPLVSKWRYISPNLFWWRKKRRLDDRSIFSANFVGWTIPLRIGQSINKQTKNVTLLIWCNQYECQYYFSVKQITVLLSVSASSTHPDNFNCDLSVQTC